MRGYRLAAVLAMSIGLATGTSYASVAKQDTPATEGDKAPPAAVPATGTAAKAADPKVDKEAAAKQLAQEVALYGSFNGPVVNSGFVFFGSRYIEAPYTVSRKGLRIFINDIEVFRHPDPVAQYPGDVDPVVPPEITKNSTMYDPVVKDYMRRKIAFVQKHNTREVEIVIMEQVWKGLPFIKEAHVDPKFPDTLDITTFDGHTDKIGLASPRRKSLQDPASITKAVERGRSSFEKQLLEGGFHFFYAENGCITFRDVPLPSQFPRIIEIIRSKDSNDTKFLRLKGEGMIDLKDGLILKLITDFSASPQLDERLKTLQPPPQKGK